MNTGRVFLEDGWHVATYIDASDGQEKRIGRFLLRSVAEAQRDRFAREHEKTARASDFGTFVSARRTRSRSVAR